MVHWTEEEFKKHQTEQRAKFKRDSPKVVTEVKQKVKDLRARLERTPEELQALKDRGANIPKRRRGERGKNKTGAQGLPAIDSGKGDVTVCPDCGARYDDTKNGAPLPRNRRQWTETQGADVQFDKFKCFCKPSGHTFDRYK